MKPDRYIKLLTNATLLIGIGLALFESVFGSLMEDSWFIAGIFTALFALVNQASSIPEMGEKINRIESKIDVSGFEKFDNHVSFYASLEKSVRVANKEILMTHIRHEPPSSFAGSTSYFNLIENWLRRNPQGVAKRISTDCNSKMRTYALSQAEAALAISNYYFRVTPWSGDFPFLNFSVIDRKTVYLAISTGEAQSLRAIKFDDPETATNMAEYFNFMWTLSKEIDQSSRESTPKVKSE